MGDKQITDTIQSMQLSLGAAQMKMQQRSFEEVAKVSELLAAKGGADGIKDDPEALAAVAGAARVPVDELRGELILSSRNCRSRKRVLSQS